VDCKITNQGKLIASKVYANINVICKKFLSVSHRLLSLNLGDLDHYQTMKYKDLC